MFYDATVTSEITTTPTCETTGIRTYTASYDGHTDTKTEVIEALGHNYQFVEFVWTEFTAQAKYVCERNTEHVVFYDATVTSEITTNPTCETTGIRTYTASYDGHTDTKTEVIEALEHNYQFVEFVWTEFTAQAKYVCENNNEHVVFYDVTVTNEVTTEPTCTETGVRTYTASYDGHTSTKTEVVEELGHTYQFIEFVWTEFTAQAKYVCSHDNTHIEYYDATITNEVTTVATCETDGIRTYTATYENHTDTKTETINKIGHNWGEWTVTTPAQPGIKGEETRVCQNNINHKQTREIPALPYVPTVNEETGVVKFNETVIPDEPKDVTNLFTQAKEEEGSVEIKAGELTLVFNNDAVNAIGANENVQLTATVLTEDTGIEDAELVLEITLEGATFADGKATLSIPFETETPEGKVAKVYYIDKDGNRTDMNAKFENGKVTFETNHFSTYAVVFEDKPANYTIFFILGGILVIALGYVAYIYLARNNKLAFATMGNKTNKTQTESAKTTIAKMEENTVRETSVEEKSAEEKTEKATQPAKKPNTTPKKKKKKSKWKKGKKNKNKKK